MCVCVSVCKPIYIYVCVCVYFALIPTGFPWCYSWVSSATNKFLIQFKFWIVVQGFFMSYYVDDIKYSHWFWLWLTWKVWNRISLLDCLISQIFSIMQFFVGKSCKSVLNLCDIFKLKSHFSAVMNHSKKTHTKCWKMWHIKQWFRD